MRKWSNFWLGSVRIAVTGPFPERFLNLCGERNLRFWDVEQQEAGTLRVTVNLFSLKRGRELAQRAGCTLRCEAWMGAPAFFARFRKRYALIAGWALAIFTACVLSQFVLVVSVEGNETIADSVVLTELESLGFGVGSYGPAVDERALANAALLDLEKLSYLNINIKGVYAQVVVRERTPIPEIEDPSRPANIVAGVDGVILDVNLLKGQSQVKEGQAVLEGELLISGTNTYESGDGSGAILGTRTAQAQGEVWAMTERTLRAATVLPVAAKTGVGEEKIGYSLRILKHSIKFPQNSSIFATGCDKIKSTLTWSLPGGVELPVGLEKTVCIPYETKQGNLDAAKAEAYLRAVLETRLKQTVGEAGDVLSKGWQTATEDGVLTVTLHASCVEQIGQTVFLEQESETAE